MKKTFTILAAVMCIATAASAQYRGDRSGGNGYDNTVGMNTNDRGNGYGDRGRNYYFSEREKDMQIARINHEYHERMQAVRFNFFMSRFKKQRIMEGLQFKRDREIHNVMENFYGRGRYHRDHDDHDRRNW
jgi:hypothetical protein